MTGGQLLAAFAVSGALLALWSYVRWPGAAPATLRGAVLRVALAIVLLQVGIGVLQLGLGVVPALAVLVVMLTVVPALTYAFLASFWFLKSCTDQLRGGY